MASTAAPFLNVPIAPVTDSRPSGKMITDQRWRSMPFNVSRYGRAPPPRGIGKALTETSANAASHLRLKIESAAATTTDRWRYLGGSASTMTAPSSALQWLATKIAPPCSTWKASRLLTFRWQNELSPGKRSVFCSTARVRRSALVLDQDPAAVVVTLTRAGCSRACGE